MLSIEDDRLLLSKWQELEQTMIEAYQQEERQREAAGKLEAEKEDVDEWLLVASTR
jgi:hypothetical protein